MNELQRDITEQLKKFRLEEIEPYIEEDEDNAHFRQEAFTKLGELGFCGLVISEEYGGMGLSYNDFCYSLEEISKSSAALAVTVSVSTMVQKIIERFGSDSHRKTYLPALTSGNEIGAFCLSESASGSDAASLKTTAKKTKGGYLLNGSKMWITSAGIAKTYIIMARTSDDGKNGISAFIARDEMEGLSYGKKEKKMGWKTSPTREVILNNCFIPEENLLLTEGEGLRVALSGLEAGRVTIASIANGLSLRALDEAVTYSLEREQFKQPIFNFQGLQFMMADMATEIEASRLLVQKASQELDKGNKVPKLASMAKLKSTDTAMSVTTDAVQILGGVGYTTEYPVERLMRDAKVLQIVEGTNQIQKVVIARQLKKEYQG